MSNTHAWLAVALLVGTSSATSQPTLDHNAPFLGHTLELTVDGAPASQAVVMFYSPHASSLATPWGLLEIERQTSQRVALGTTDASGHALLAIPIPADASIAENEAHFQALIDDPSAPAGKTLSHGVHVRLLGTRVYSVYWESGDYDGAGMDIVSAVHENVVAHVPFDASSFSSGRPVFRHDYSVGAVVDGRYGLVLFDPFFGEVRARLQFDECSFTLLTDVSQERVFVLERSGRITSVDLATGAVTGVLDLAGDCKAWCSNDRRSEAYVGVYGGPQLGSSIRRVDLGALSELGTITVADGAPRQVVNGVAFADQTLVVTSNFFHETPGASFYTMRGALTRVDLSGPAPVSSVAIDDDWLTNGATISVAADEIVMCVAQPAPSWAPAYNLHHASLSHAGPITTLPTPPTPPLVVREMVPQDTGLWMTGYGSHDPLDTHFGYVAHADLTGVTWTVEAAGLWPPPKSLATARDRFVDRVYVSLPRDPHPDPNHPATHGPALLAIDGTTHAQHYVALEHSPGTLRVIEVP